MSDTTTSPAAATPEPQAGVIAKDVIAGAAIAEPFIPNPLAQAIIMLVAQYGPGIIDRIESALNKSSLTITDIRAIFADLKPYSAFGIPDVVPTITANN